MKISDKDIRKVQKHIYKVNPLVSMFLKQHKLFKEFTINLILNAKSVDRALHRRDFSPSAAFVFSETTRGHEFWKNIDIKFSKYKYIKSRLNE